MINSAIISRYMFVATRSRISHSITPSHSFKLHCSNGGELLLLEVDDEEEEEEEADDEDDVVNDGDNNDATSDDRSIV